MNKAEFYTKIIEYITTDEDYSFREKVRAKTLLRKYEPFDDSFGYNHMMATVAAGVFSNIFLRNLEKNDSEINELVVAATRSDKYLFMIEVGKDLYGLS